MIVESRVAAAPQLPIYPLIAHLLLSFPLTVKLLSYPSYFDY